MAPVIRRRGTGKRLPAKGVSMRREQATTMDDKLPTKGVNPVGRAAGAAALLLVLPAAWGGSLYRWVDEAGIRHIESSIPPEYAQKGYEVLDDRSLRVVERVAPALSAEELAAEQQRKAEAAKREQERLEAERRDRALLATYSSVEDMELARDGQLKTLDALTESTRKSAERLGQNLDALIESAAGYEREGRKAPAKLLTDIDKAKHEVARLQQQVKVHQQRKQEIRDSFARDIARYKVLRGQ